MINYKLAQQLKKAGFLQEGNGINSELLDSGTTSEININRENVYYPTLSELIKEFGDNGTFILQKVGGVVDWYASYNYLDLDEKMIKVFRIGKIPEEAVANLWLEFHS